MFLGLWAEDRRNSLVITTRFVPEGNQDIESVMGERRTAATAHQARSASGKEAHGRSRVAMLDTHVFKLNEYFVELNPANFKVLNRILN